MYSVLVLKVPLRKGLKEELICFWQGVFQTNYDGLHEVFDANEKGYNHDVVYLVRKKHKLGGTCHLYNRIYSALVSAVTTCFEFPQSLQRNPVTFWPFVRGERTIILMLAR